MTTPSKSFHSFQLLFIKRAVYVAPNRHKPQTSLKGSEDTDKDKKENLQELLS